MVRVIRILFLLGLMAIALVTIVAQAASPSIVVLNVKGVINPVMADYVSRGIEEAEERNATACIIQPGFGHSRYP